VTRISWNVNAQALGGQRDLITRYWTDARPTTILIMEDIGYAQGLHALRPDAYVIHRSFADIGSDDWFKALGNSIQEGAARYCEQVRWVYGAHKNLWVYAVNEPHWDTDSYINSAKDIYTFFEIVIRTLAPEGFRLVVGNWPPGMVDHPEDGQGFLRACSEYRDRVLLSEHSYGSPAVPLQMNRLRGNVYVSHEDMARRMVAGEPLWEERFWPTRDDVKAAWDSGVNLWHTLRISKLYKYAAERGWPLPKFVSTECFWDNMPDLANRDFYNVLAGRWGTSGKPELKGHQAYRDMFRAWWPQWSFEEAIAKQLQWADATFPDEWLGANLFTASYNERWDGAFGHTNFLREPQIFELMIKYAQEGAPVITPTPDYVWRGAFVSAVHSSGSTNVRADRSASAPLLGSVQVGDAIEIGFVNGVAERVTANGFTWQTVRYNGQRAFIGGAFAYKLDATGPLPEPDPEPEPQPDPEPEPPNADEITELRLKVATLQETVNTLSAENKTLTAKIDGILSGGIVIDQKTKLRLISEAETASTALDTFALILAQSGDTVTPAA
jgi:hypothetical protein